MKLRTVMWLATAVVLLAASWSHSCPPPPCSPVISVPSNGSTIGGGTTFTVSGCAIDTTKFIRLYFGTGPNPNTVTFDFAPGITSQAIDTTKVPNGTYTSQVIVWDQPTGTIKSGTSPTINLTVANGGPTPTPTPTPTATGATVDFGTSVGTGIPAFLGTESIPNSTTMASQLKGAISTDLEPINPADPLPAGSSEAAYQTCLNGGGGTVCDPTTWNWSRIDGYLSGRLANAAANNMHVQWEIINGEPNSWSGCTSETTNPNSNAACFPNNWVVWKDIVTKVVQHVQAMCGWPDLIQIGSEPDTGPPVSMYMNDAQYGAYYLNTATAIRALNASALLGGPTSVSGANVGYYANGMKNLAGVPASLVNFGSYHNYTAAGNEDSSVNSAFHTYYPNVPMYVTEWNIDGSCQNPLDGNGYLGYTGSRLISLFQLGDGGVYYTWGANGGGSCVSWDSNNNAYPKLNAWYLLNTDLGLGAGNAVLYSTATNNVSSSQGAINSAGNDVVAVSSYGWGAAAPLTITANGLANKTWSLQLFMADGGANDGHSAIANTNVVVTNGSLVYTFNMSANAIAGIVLK